MPDITPILALPVLVPNQAQPYVTHNGALRRLDVLVQLSVAETGAVTPPALPEEGALYALGAVPTGAWAGHPLALAAYAEGSWLFIDPQEGWRAWVRDESRLRVWDGAGWVLPPTTLDPADLDDLPGLGIATAHDATNRLAVKAAATLLSHDGAGHQLKINKAAAGETASLLFQSDWTGHAEMGLAGGTDWSVKVSPDGSAWTEALAIAAADGQLRAGAGLATGLASGGGGSGLLAGDGDRLALTPTDRAGGYQSARALYFDAAGDGIWTIEGGLQVNGPLQARSVRDGTEPLQRALRALAAAAITRTCHDWLRGVAHRAALQQLAQRATVLERQMAEQAARQAQAATAARQATARLAADAITGTCRGWLRRQARQRAAAADLGALAARLILRTSTT